MKKIVVFLLLIPLILMSGCIGPLPNDDNGDLDPIPGSWVLNEERDIHYNGIDYYETVTYFFSVPTGDLKVEMYIEWYDGCQGTFKFINSFNEVIWSTVLYAAPGQYTSKNVAFETVSVSEIFKFTVRNDPAQYDPGPIVGYVTANIRIYVR